MLFNSFSFLLFFIVVLLVSRSIAGWTWRKLFLLLASYSFYASWNPPFVALIWFSTLLDWHAGKRMHSSATPAGRRFFLALSLTGNLGVLAYFKYAGFFVENWNALAEALGLPVGLGRPDIILPVGISFYTFQTLSYTIDLYRGRRTPCTSFLDYALFVTFFPQLMSGPIMRSTEFLPQCAAPRKGNADQVTRGAGLMVLGLFSKAVIADGLMAPVVNQAFGAAGAPGFLSSWAGTLAFAVQIFCDFFGYSVCAMGVALTLGFVLTDNFRFPYAAVGFADFWQRWHISLSFWLRDYLFLPAAYAAARRIEDRTVLGIRIRQDTWSYAVATMITMLIAGLWHGASWLFVLWGGLHGVCLVAERPLRRSRIGRLRFWRSEAGQIALTLFTFVLVCFAWVFFRAKSVAQAFTFLGDMLSIPQALEAAGSALAGVRPADGGLWLGWPNYIIVFGTAAGLFILHRLLRSKTLEASCDRIPRPLGAVLVGVLLYLVLISMTGEDRAFIYFQF